MELWIRSQDKEVLTRVIDIWKDADKNEIWSKSSFATKNCLGIYKTKERALEVLDEIQKMLYAGLHAANNNLLAGTTSIVYEMPKN